MNWELPDVPPVHEMMQNGGFVIGEDQFTMKNLKQLENKLFLYRDAVIDVIVSDQMITKLLFEH